MKIVDYPIVDWTAIGASATSHRMSQAILVEEKQTAVHQIDGRAIEAHFFNPFRMFSTPYGR